MAAILWGLHDWSLKTDDKDYRDYNVDWLVKVEDPWNEGPGYVFNVAGVGAVGDQYNIGFELDPWAYLAPDMSVRAHSGGRGEPAEFWILSQRYTTKPMGRNNGNSPGNPLLEPADIGGTFVKFKKEATRDKDGNPITNSSREILRGPAVERDYNLPTVTITKNYASLPLGDLASFIDCKSSVPMWGLEAGQVKLSNVRWAKKYYKLAQAYYALTMEFDVDYDKFLKRPVDEGTRVYIGHGDRNNVANYIMYTDKLQELGGSIMLDGNGNALEDTTDPTLLEIDLLTDANLLLLGVPGSL